MSALATWQMRCMKAIWAAVHNAIPGSEIAALVPS